MRSRWLVIAAGVGAAPLDEAMAWIGFYQRLWARKLDGLDAYFTLRNGTEGNES